TSIRLTQANPKKFNMKTLSFDDLILEDNTTWAYQATTIAGYIIPLLLIVVYISIFSFLRKKRKSSKLMLVTSTTDETATKQRANQYYTFNDDFQILIQALVVSISLEISRLISAFAPMMQFDDNTKWMINISASVSSVANHALNPLIFVCTNKMVRKFYS
ncbi:hypothetical protein PMAYCL1PPCAC_09151, partial [Pristionchus mayeri]